MKTFSKPFHELGGVFVDYKANRARRSPSATTSDSADLGGRRHRRSRSRSGWRPCVEATWSPTAPAIAFFVHGEDATHIWIADVATGKSRQLTKTPVLATLVTTFEFSDGRQADRDRPRSRGRAAMPRRRRRRRATVSGLNPTRSACARFQPDVDAVREGAARVARDGPGRAHRRPERRYSASWLPAMVRAARRLPDASTCA